MDSALDDFLKRFGDDDPGKSKVQNVTRSPAVTSSELKPNGLASFSPEINFGKPNSEEVLNDKSIGLGEGNEMSLGDKASKGAGMALDALPSAMSLVDNIKGGQFDTSADSSGPGKAGGAIMQGAAQGSQLASSLGLKDPLSQGIAMLGGGLISTFAHTGAMKEYRKNQVKANLKENALEKAKRSEETAMEEGMASMENLKALRQKQLGILS